MSKDAFVYLQFRQIYFGYESYATIDKRLLPNMAGCAPQLKRARNDDKAETIARIIAHDCNAIVVRRYDICDIFR